MMMEFTTQRNIHVIINRPWQLALLKIIQENLVAQELERHYA